MDTEPRAEQGRAAFRRILTAAPARVDAVERDFLPGRAERLPAVVRARRPGIDLTGWLSEHPEAVADNLTRYGGVLFRGFEVDSQERFRAFAASQITTLSDYNERSTPRSAGAAANVYTSTEYPADQYIEQHNELAYSHIWPSRIAFYCATAAETGGATPIADSRGVYSRLDPAVRDRFARTGVQYLRNYGAGVDLSWQEAFQTTDRAEVERYCRAAETSVEWLGEDGLRTRQVRQAVIEHPVTGDRVWFNSAHMFHVAGLAAGVRDSLRALLAEDELPRHAYFGDGTPIDDEVIHEIRAAYRAETVAFPWERGDVLLLDNMLASHGRQPYTGERAVLVSFGDPVREVAGAVVPASETGAAA